MKFAKRHRVVLEALEERRLFSTYFVSPAGSDSASGGSSAPFQTLQQGVSVLQPGDTLDVRAGTYAGFVIGWDPAGQSVYGVIAGTASAPITIEADPNAAAGSVVIDSRDNKTADGIDLEPGCNYINIDNFTVEDGDGSITRAGIRVTGSDFVNVVGNTTTGLGTWGIFTGFSSDMLIENNVCSGSVAQHGIYVSNSPVDVQILDNTCFDNHDCGIQINADLSQGGTGIATGCVVAGNIVYDNGAGGGAAINLDGVQDSSIENNVLYGNTHTGIALFVQDGAAGPSGDVVTGNTVVMPSSGLPAIEVVNPAGANTVFDNIFIGQVSFDPGTVEGNDYIGVSIAGNVFVNASADDFALVAGSPAAGIGVASFNGFSAPAIDIQGNPFADDAGAYQNVGQIVPPTVANFIVNDGSAQRSVVTSVTVAFSEAVKLSPGALTLVGSSQAFSVSNPSSDQKTYVVAFTGGSLPNGSYQLAVNAADVHNLAGTELAGGDQTFGFHRLYGDFGGNGTVNLTDLLSLLNAYGLSSGQSGYQVAFDSNGDGTINLTDLLAFLNDYGLSAASLGEASVQPMAQVTKTEAIAGLASQGSGSLRHRRSEAGYANRFLR